MVIVLAPPEATAALARVVLAGAAELGEIDAPVLEEARVLGGDHGAQQDRTDVAEGDAAPVDADEGAAEQTFDAPDQHERREGRIDVVVERDERERDATKPIAMRAHQRRTRRTTRIGGECGVPCARRPHLSVTLPSPARRG